MTKTMMSDNSNVRSLLNEGGGDWMFQLVQKTMQILMSADADNQCSAASSLIALTYLRLNKSGP